MKQILLAALFVFVGGSAMADKLKEGDAFPKDLAGTKLIDIKTKKELKLSDLGKGGKVVILDFWASWCGPCKEAIPALSKLSGKYKGKGLVVVGINVDEKAADRDAFLATHKVNFQLVSDEGQKIVKALSIGTMPTSFVLDSSGKIALIHKAFRPGDEKKYEETIKKFIK